MECAIIYKQIINHGVVCSITVMCRERREDETKTRTKKQKNPANEKHHRTSQ